MDLLKKNEDTQCSATDSSNFTCTNEVVLAVLLSNLASLLILRRYFQRC